MELIASLNGSAALRVSGDDVKPEQDFMMRDLIEFLASTYHFSIKPNVMGVPLQALPGLFFQSGFMGEDDKKIPIMQLSIITNGDIVTAATTEIADTILDDVMSKLDDAFGYKFKTTKKHRLYQSNIVVKFTKGVEEKIKAIGKIEEILNREIQRPAMPFKIKRLAFGHGNIELQPQMTLEALESSDFVIERRANEPYSENRYFCAAPTTTSDLIKIVEQIEKALG